jgi:tRNA pseudouridine38-40 synthase
MRRYKMIIAYDGTDYSGWQKQKNSLTIQEVIESALSKITSEIIEITGSGRTDAGVHARGQVAHFDLFGSPPPIKNLNCIIRDDIRILSLEEIHDDFHARFSAKEKTYHYHVTLDKIQSPFEKNYSLHNTFNFDEKKLIDSLPLFLGKKDFSSFANELKPHRNPLKTMHELSFHKTNTGFYLKYRADGFLYKMVRNITGTLLDISRGKIDISEVENIFESKNRSFAGKAAPPHGLFLHEVLY